MNKGLSCLLVLAFFLLLAEWACCEQPLIPISTGFYGNFYSVFQANSPLKTPRGDKKRLYPFYQYLELSAVSPKNNLSFNTFLRAREILNGEDRTFDVYNAYLEYNNVDTGFYMRLGRQVLTEGTNFALMDGGLVRIKAIDGVELVTYGGYQDRDAQPDPEEPIRSFGIFGANLKLSNILSSLITLGYEGISPDDFSTRHFLNFSFHRVLPFTDFADLYSRLEFDIEEANPAFFNAGIGISLAKPLYVNLEYNTYKPDEDRDSFLQDRIFDVFSLSRLHEARIGITYFATNYLEVGASYSYARYDAREGEPSNGSIIKIGFTWDFWQRLGLRAFNGFYLIDGRERDRALGLNFGVSEEILRGLELQFSFAYANFKSIANKDGNAFSYIMGSQYLLIRNLVLRAEVELNTNPDFEKDVRTNLGVSYYF